MKDNRTCSNCRWWSIKHDVCSNPKVCMEWSYTRCAHYTACSKYEPNTQEGGNDSPV